MEMINQNLVDNSHIVACILHLREASRCIENEHDSISLAILKLAESIAQLHSVDDQQLDRMRGIADEISQS